MAEYKPGDQVLFLALFQVASSGLGKTGLTATISINTITASGTSTNVVSAASATAMVAADSTNQPGLYIYSYTITAGFFGYIAAQATTTDTTCSVRSLEMLHISSPGAMYTVYGTATAGSSTSITLTGTSTQNDLYNGQTLYIQSGTGAGQARIITGYVGSTKVATVGRTWAITPDNTSVYIVYPPGTVNLASILDVLVSTSTAQFGVNLVNVKGTASVGAAGYMGVDWANITAPTTTVDLSGTTIKNVNNAIATVTTTTNLTNAPTAGDFTSTMKTSLNASTPVSVGSVSNPASIWTYADRTLTSIGNIVNEIVSRLTGVVSIVLSPITANYRLTIYKGDTYSVASGQTILFTSTSWADLTGATIYFNLNNTQYAVTIVESGTSEQSIRVDLTATQSLGMSLGDYGYFIRATLSDAVTVKTLINGICTVSSPEPPLR